jgi:CheY-like chemotaxis protein
MGVEIWHGKRALVVEDEAMVTMMLGDMLNEMGCTVAGTAAKLEEALAMARSLAMDFAILDLNLDGQLTYPVADALAERGVPVIFSTGYSANALPKRYGAIPSLRKPFQTRELERAVVRALQPAE